MTVQFSSPNPTFFDKDTNLPLAGGLIYYYIYNTTTLTNTYSDPALTTPNTNPIQLNSSGSFNTPVFLAPGTYKIVVYSAVNNLPVTLQWTRDNYDVVSVASFSASQASNLQTGTTYTVQTTDRSKKVVQSNINPVATTLPQAGTNFPDGWYSTYSNEGAGQVTITPVTSKISGFPFITLTRGQSINYNSDGTDYHADIIGESVGSRKMWYSSTAPFGWIFEETKTLGSAASGADYDDEIYRALYVHLYELSDSYAPVSGGRGVDANTDFDANKTLTIPLMQDMSPYGAGGTLAPGQTGGAASVTPTGTITVNGITLSAANIPSITSSATTNDADNTVTLCLAPGNTGGGHPGTVSNAITSNNTSGAAFTPTGTTAINSISTLSPVRATPFIIKY